jgi:hypothetical protein
MVLTDSAPSSISSRRGLVVGLRAMLDGVIPCLVWSPMSATIPRSARDEAEGGAVLVVRDQVASLIMMRLAPVLITPVTAHFRRPEQLADTRLKAARSSSCGTRALTFSHDEEVGPSARLDVEARTRSPRSSAGSFPHSGRSIKLQSNAGMMHYLKLQILHHHPTRL